jgi:hypothetical protein
MEDDKLLGSLILSDLFVLEGGLYETVLHFDVSIVAFPYLYPAAWNEDKLVTPVSVNVKESVMAGDQLVLGNEGCGRSCMNSLGAYSRPDSN